MATKSRSTSSEQAQPGTVDMDKITSLAKRRGFVFQSSEIYGGLASTWDYGPLGVLMKNNIKAAWWRAMVQDRDDIVGMDAAILMHPDVWKASGHLEVFHDPLVECLNCQHRFRFDHLLVGQVVGDGPKFVAAIAGGSEDEVRKLVQAKAKKAGSNIGNVEIGPARVDESLDAHIHGHGSIGPLSAVPCPACDTVGSLTKPRMFNLMFKTFMGPVEDSAATVYLRPETAQGIFVNFENVQTTTRKKLPFGVAQIGKSFRNEITTGNFVFRSREFEVMEMEFFVKPGADDEWYRHWVQARLDWWTGLGIRPESLRVREHGKDEMSHYSKGTSDIEFKYAWDWGELEGIANRGNYDLTQHGEHSGKALKYFDDEIQESFVPYVVEPAAGVDRGFLAFLTDAYREEMAPTGDSGQAKEELRVVLRLHPAIAPIKVAVLPLSKKEPLAERAKEVAATLRKHWMVQYDDAQSIGRRYRRQDEIGTPLAVTIDFQSLEDQQVTIRDRDSMQQVRLPIEDLVPAVRDRLGL